jgi:hypothetical protein
MRKKSSKKIPKFNWKDQFRNPNNEKLLSALENNWPNAFKVDILPHIIADSLRPFFCDNNGRPTKNIKTMTGLLVLQDIFDLTDSETLDRLLFDLSFCWALDIQIANDNTQFVSPKTFYNFKHLILKNGLDKIIFSDSTKHLIDDFKVKHRLKRMNLIYCNSNMKRLAQFELMIATVEKFLYNLKEESTQTINAIEPILVERYLGKDDQGFNYFGHVRPSERDKAIFTVANDIYTLINIFESNPLVAAMPAFAFLNMVFNNQCQINCDDKTQAGSVIVLKDDSDIDSLINLDNYDFSE